MHPKPCVGLARALLCLSILFFSSKVFANEHYDGIVSTVHQVAEIIRRGERAESWRITRTKSDLETILLNPDQINNFLEFAYGRGLLHLDGFKDDLLFIQERVKDPATKDATVDRLKELGFIRLALYFSDIPKHESVTAAAREIDEADRGESDFRLPGNKEGVTIEDRAWKTLTKLEGDYTSIAAKLDEFVQAGERFEGRVWWGHTLLVTTLAALSLYHGYELLELGKMTTKEMIGLLGGIWATNSGTFYMLFQYTGLMEVLKPIFEKTRFREVKEAWKNLMSALPILAARTASAAAMDKPESPWTRVDAYSMAAFEALLETNAPEATEQLFQRALRYLQNGHLRQARRAFAELDKRAPQDQLRNLTKVVDKAFKAKRSLESRVFWRQFGAMSLKLALVGTGLWAANKGIQWLTPEWVSTWAKIPTAVMASLGVTRILKFLWRPQKRERVDTYTVDDRAALMKEFRALMVADPTGEILRCIASNQVNSATQNIVTECAVDAMAEVSSGRVTLEMYRLGRDTVSMSNENGPRVKHLIKATFKQHRGCLTAFVNATSGLAETVRPHLADDSATAPPADPPPAEAPTLVPPPNPPAIPEANTVGAPSAATL